MPDDAKAAIVADASRLLKGEWEILGAVRADMERPDWFYDPVTGRRSAPEAYAFSLDQRNESAVGNIKQVWEINRLQHLTLLAVAWYLTGKRMPMRSGLLNSLHRGGGRTRSCPASTGRAVSNWASG